MRYSAASSAPSQDTTTKLSLLAAWWKWLMTRLVWIKADFRNTLYVIGGGVEVDVMILHLPPHHCSAAPPKPGCPQTFSRCRAVCTPTDHSYHTHTLASCSTANWHTSANFGSSGSLIARFIINGPKTTQRSTRNFCWLSILYPTDYLYLFYNISFL